MEHVIILNDILFDNAKFWAYFLSVNYPCAVLEEMEYVMYDLVKQALPVDVKWSEEFTRYYDGVLDETDGYLDNPTTLIAPLDGANTLKIEFHPGDTIFYINEMKIGCTGPHWEIQKIPYDQIKKSLSLENGSVLFQLLLPMAILKPDEIIDIKPILEKQFSNLGFTSSLLSQIIECLISGITEQA